MIVNENDSQIKELINDLFKKILKRDSDPSGLNYYFDRIKNNKLELEQMPQELMNSEEYKKIQKKIEPIKLKLKKPIFMIGVPRTGTTYSYRFLCKHPNVFYFSHLDLEFWLPKSTKKSIEKKYTKMLENKEPLPRSEEYLFVFGTKFQHALRKEWGNEVPIEGETLWKNFLPSYEKNISADKIAEIRRIFQKSLDRTTKKKFVNKAPQNSARLYALKKIFPDAKFINMIRDPRAVVSSMMKRTKKEGSFGTGIPVLDKKKYDKLDTVQKWAWKYMELIQDLINSKE